jgi:hypothetical protein
MPDCGFFLGHVDDPVLHHPYEPFVAVVVT